RSARSSAVDASPSAASRSASSRERSWCRPPMPPRAFATTQRASDAQIQPAPIGKPRRCQSQIPKTNVPSTPTKTTGSTTRISRSRNAVSLGRSARTARTFSTPAATEPPKKQKADATCSIRSHSLPVTGASVRFAADGRAREALAPADGDDRGRQLDAGLAGGPRARRDEGRIRAGGGRVLRLSLRRSRRRARAPRDARDADRRDVAPAADASWRGDHRLRSGGAGTGDARVAGAPRSALQELPEPPGGRVRVDPRGADPDARRDAGGRAQ